MPTESRMCVPAKHLKIAELLRHICSESVSNQMWNWSWLLCSKRSLPNVKENPDTRGKRTKELGWEQ